MASKISFMISTLRRVRPGMRDGTSSGMTAERINAVHKVSSVSKKTVSPKEEVLGSSPRGVPEPPHDQFQGLLAKAIKAASSTGFGTCTVTILLFAVELGR